MTINKFNEELKIFIEIITKIQLQSDNKKNSSRLSQFFDDKTLIEGLKLIQDPIDFLEFFPLIGVGCQLKRCGDFEKDHKLTILSKAYFEELEVDSRKMNFET